MGNAMPPIRGFRFFFYSNEGNEPPHVHVAKGGGNAKWWLNPLSEEYSYGFTIQERRIIKKIIKSNRAKLIAKWYEEASKK
jgi:hypothetical protein